MTPPDERFDRFCRRLFRQNEHAIKLGLERVRAALDAEGAPDRAFDHILVAGTNGKGSVTCLCHAALRERGRRVGLFTSPHLVGVRERIRIDGIPIDADTMLRLGTELLNRWSDALPESERLTYFELMTLLAERYFAEQGVDLALMEVGLGGRLDATNATDPVLSVITRVDLDHTRYLGETLEAVFAEKAGVLRADRPAVVCCPTGWSPSRTRAAAEARGARPVWVEGEDFGVNEDDIVVGGVSVGTAWVPLRGRHQRENAAVALATVSLARDQLGLNLPSDAALAERMRRARWPGRWEQLTVGDTPVWLDVAHNPSAAQALANLIGTEFEDPVTVVLGVSQDKDLGGILRALRPVSHRLIATRADNPRATDPARIVDMAERLHIPDHGGQPIEHVAVDTLAGAVALACTFDEPVVVAGSLYLAGDLLRLVGRTEDDLEVIAH